MRVRNYGRQRGTCANGSELWCRYTSVRDRSAHGLTVHKAQGSQWDDVVLFDESDVFRENRGRWLYTGVTRAAKRLCVVV